MAPYSQSTHILRNCLSEPTVLTSTQLAEDGRLRKSLQALRCFLASIVQSSNSSPTSNQAAPSKQHIMMCPLLSPFACAVAWSHMSTKLLPVPTFSYRVPWTLEVGTTLHTRLPGPYQQPVWNALAVIVILLDFMKFLHPLQLGHRVHIFQVLPAIKTCRRKPLHAVRPWDGRSYSKCSKEKQHETASEDIWSWNGNCPRLRTTVEGCEFQCLSLDVASRRFMSLLFLEPGGFLCLSMASLVNFADLAVADYPLDSSYSSSASEPPWTCHTLYTCYTHVILSLSSATCQIPMPTRTPAHWPGTEEVVTRPISAHLCISNSLTPKPLSHSPLGSLSSFDWTSSWIRNIQSCNLTCHGLLHDAILNAQGTAPLWSSSITLALH